MAYIEIYNRQLNIWNRYKLIAGYAENWVLDKTTDTAKDIEFKVQGFARPLIDINDWVRIIHTESVSQQATHTADGLPLNHTQYIVGALTADQNKALNYWHISLELIEPIERFKGISGEVLTYTNQVSKDVFNPATGTTTTYVKEPYNHETALDRWLKLTPANCDNYASGYNKNNNIGWYNRISIPSADRTFLSNIPFGDQTINGRNLYEVLMDIFDSSTGRTPVAYFDINTTTRLPKNPARDEYILRFERQDGFNKADIALETLTNGASRFLYTKGLSNYATGLVGDMENMAVAEDIEYPAQRLYVVPEVGENIRSTTGKTANTSDDWVLRTPFAIKKVLKVEKIQVQTYFVVDPVTPQWSASSTKTDLTSKVYEEKEYNALTPDPASDADILKYKEGDNKIIVRGYKYGSTIYNELMYYIEYQPLLNPRVLIGSGEYQESVNQIDGQAEASKQADFMAKYLQGMNKADIVINKTYDNYIEFENFIGSRVIDGDKTYLITSQSYKNRNYQYDVFLQLNENHFRKSDTYQAAGEIQKNIAIGYENIKERKTAIKERINLGLTAQTNEQRLLSIDKRTAVSGLAPTKRASEHYPQIALIKGESVLQKTIGTEDYTIYRVAPLAKYSFGNQLHLHYKFYDNADAGKSKSARSQFNPGGIELFYTTFRVENQIPNLYTDFFGELQKVTTYFANVNEIDISNINSTSQADYDILQNFYRKMLSLPTVNETQRNELIARSVLTVNNRLLLKDQLEQLNENYIIELASNDFIVTSNLAKLSRVMQPSDTHTIKLVLLNTKKAAKEGFTSGETVHTASITSGNTTLAANYVNYSFTGHSGAFESAIIATNDNEPLIIINNTSAISTSIAAGSLRIYFN